VGVWWGTWGSKELMIWPVPKMGPGWSLGDDLGEGGVELVACWGRVS